MSTSRVDRITLERIKQAHPKVREELLKIYNEANEALKGRAILRFAYVLRTFEEQNNLFQQGRTRLFDSKGNRLGIVTSAKGGQSYHNYGLAVDIVLLVDNGSGVFNSASWETQKDFDGDGLADWIEVVNVFKKYGWEWGGDWKGRLRDLPHFQKTLKHSWRDLLAKYQVKDFIPKTNYVNI